MAIRSPYPPVDIPNTSIYDTIFATLQDSELERIAVTDSATGQQVTFGELRQHINLVAGALAARGLKPHDVVGLHCPNSYAFIVTFHAIMRAGGTVTTLGSLLTAEDIAQQLKTAQATMVFSTNMLGEAGFRGAASCGIPADSIYALETELPAMLKEGRSAPDVTIDSATHVAAMPFSSGTTGVAKGVRLSHRNLVANMMQLAPRLEPNGMHGDSVVMCVLPFFHIYGMNALLNNCLMARAHQVTMPKFDLVEFLELHEKYDIELSFIAPPIAVALAKHPIVDKFKLQALDTMISGAAALDGELAAHVGKRLNCKIMQGFGMTETSPVTHLSDVGITPLESIGMPLPNTESKVVDITDEQLREITPPTDEGSRSADGEMWIRGPQVMLGYLNNPEADAKTLTADGWLRTGDIVNLDHLGNTYVVDRMKELIKYKGYQVAPAELEALLMTRDDVADVAVVGFTREEDGEEVPRAFIARQVTENGNHMDIDPAELMAWVAERVTPYKKIRMVDFLDSVPKSNTGKILRKDLRNVPATSDTAMWNASYSA